MQAQPTIAVNEAVQNACLAEAARMYPLETGGAFMGVLAGTGTFVLSEMIGAGPDARHYEHLFEPDAEWQWSEMARLHALHSGQIRFLGDWHTHPKATRGRLSGDDKAAVRTILSSPDSQTDVVITAILAGGPDYWVADAWVAKGHLFFGVLAPVHFRKAKITVGVE